jgi:hypothetical protein
MLKPILTSAVFAGALALSPATMAQWYGAPGGSYLESCGDVQVFGDSLAAHCRRVDGGWQRTVLRGLGSCAGDISNQNGHLTCGRGGYGSSYGPYNSGPGPYEGHGRGPYGGYGYGWGR